MINPMQIKRPRHGGGVYFFLLLPALAAISVHADESTSATVAAKNPNIVYILADDMGIGDVSSLNPHCAWQTPNLDRLAREGTAFTDAHSASGVCTPSRYTLLTGRYSWRGSLKKSVQFGYSPSLIEPGRTTVASFLRGHGYHTAMIGKWHLGLDWALAGPEPTDVDWSKPFAGGPTAHGFDSFFGISASLDMPPYVYLENDRVAAAPTGTIGESPVPPMWRAGAISPDFRHEDVLPRFTEKAVRYIADRSAAQDGKPFFLYISLAAPHTPIVPTPEFDGASRTNAYGDFVLQTDDAVGQILAALDEHGLTSNTLVIFTSDNGFAPAANLEELRSFNHDPNAGYRGHKADIYEGGHRVPFIARWPGHTPAGARDAHLIGQVDLLATCADMLGVTLPESAGEDSISMLPLLRGEASAAARETLINHSVNGSFAIRLGKWKLCLCPGSGGWSYPNPDRDDTSGMPDYQLFDLDADPAERNNLAHEHPDLVQRMGRLLRDDIERGRSTLGTPQPYTTSVDWPQIGWMKDFTANDTANRQATTR